MPPAIFNRVSLEWGLSHRMAFLGFHIDDAVAERFAALAANEGGKSNLLRRLVEQAVGSDAAIKPPAPLSQSSCKITIRLREGELRLLESVAAQRRMTRTQWVASAVRTRLGFPVQQTHEEAQALRAVVRELNRIGGNINQIAHASNLNRLIGLQGRLDAEALRAASDGVQAALAEVREILRRNASYWEGRL
ncbi:MAG: plasmid mobilization protein [Methylocystis sp.]|uniref:plasmid mobilization protein n=1 Tax=Methylocystis sp. TaxID=1911079 RepID=UPI003DA29AC3